MKKTLKRILATFLTVIMLFSALPLAGLPTKASAATQVDIIIAKAQEIANNNPHAYDGLCLAFCGVCYEAAGYSHYSINTAYEAGSRWIISSSSSNIPIGALVFYDYSWNANAGHVGIYAGNGKMYDAESQYGGVKLRTFSTKGYRGWGWYGGIEPNGSSGGTTQPPTNPNIRLNQVWYDLSDTVEITASAVGATDYYVGFFKNEERILTQEVKNGVFSFRASQYGLGDYSAYITCLNSKGYVDTEWVHFSIVGAPGYSNVYSNKECYQIGDTVVLNVNTVCAKGQVIGLSKNGSRVLTKDVSVPLYLKASDYGAGVYDFYFSVYNGSGTIDTIHKNFTIGVYKVTLNNSGANTAGTSAYWYKYNVVSNGIYYYTDANCTSPLNNSIITCPKKSGYIFNGYYTGQNGSGTQYIDSNGACINSIFRTENSKTLYAYWKADSYTVSFNANDGSCSTSTKSVTYNSTYGTLPTPTRAGYDFDGWYTSATGGNKITSSSTVTITANQTLYAHWISTHTHSYNAAITKEATCSETGIMTYLCSCGDSYTESIPLKSHTEGSWEVTKKATYDEEGIKTLYCKDCGKELKSEAIPVVTKPTVTLSSSQISLGIGETVEIPRTINNPDKIAIDVKYGMKNNSIANVTVKDGKYIITGVNTGSTVLAVYIYEKGTTNIISKSEIPVTVVSSGKVKSVSINNLSISYKENISVYTKIEMEGDVNYKVEYKSLDPSVATVDKNNGNVYGVKKWGISSTTIICTVTDEYGNVVEDKCEVECGFAWWQWIIGILLFGFLWY